MFEKNILGARKWVKVINNNNKENKIVKSLIKIQLLDDYNYYVRLYFAKKGGIRLQISQDFLGFYSIIILKDDYEKLVEKIPSLLEFANKE